MCVPCFVPAQATGSAAGGGGGTINTLLLAESGRLNLTGSSIAGRAFAIPLTIGTFSNPSVLQNWSVFLNGERAYGVALRWDETTQAISVYTLGTLILLN